MLQQFSSLKDCEAQEILGRSSLSATKAPQYQKFINGLGQLSLEDFSGL
jgi:hypothetical protein